MEGSVYRRAAFKRGKFRKFPSFVNYFPGIKVLQLKVKFFLKVCYHGNRENASYSSLLQHDKLEFGTQILRISVNLPSNCHLN